MCNDNSLCEICENDPAPIPNPDNLGWYYWLNIHCIELRRNRDAREKKNYYPTNTVF